MTLPDGSTYSGQFEHGVAWDLVRILSQTVEDFK